jgi:myo-inositol-1(or 4)-monophosphatase
MEPVKLGTGWTQILLEAAENVRSGVRSTILNRPSMGVQELKDLLDAEAQQAIRKTLKDVGEPVHVISEEGDYSIGEGGPYIVADPVDGTTNLAKGIPLAVTSLAISETPQLSGVRIGVILDLYTGETYRAEMGRGSWRGGQRMTPSGPKLLNDALVSMDISKGHPLEPMEPIIQRARYLRQYGCSALSICHVASGIMDAHVDLRGTLRITDAAAALLMLKEAGGVYIANGEMNGDIELSRESRLTLIAASNLGTLEEILDNVS